MANGRLAAVKPLANTDTLLYTCPTGQIATVSLSVGRQSTNKDELVRIALVDGLLVALAAEDYLEYDSTILSYDKIAMSAGESLIVRADAATVSFVLFGYEEAA